MREEAFAKVVAAYSDNGRQVVSDPTFDRWWRLFGHLSDETFEAALDRHMLAVNYVPMVHELRAAIEAVMSEEERQRECARRIQWQAFNRRIVPHNYGPERVAEVCAELGLSPARTGELVAIAERRRRALPAGRGDQ